MMVMMMTDHYSRYLPLHLKTESHTVSEILFPSY
jgi:hypothetical protein